MIEKLKTIEDLKAISVSDLRLLVDECHQLVSTLKLTDSGLDPNIVELAIAIHYVFDLSDTLLIDSAYGSPMRTLYTGKISSLLMPFATAAVPNMDEYVAQSKNNFTLGHSTSSMSIAAGWAIANRLRGDNHPVLVYANASSLTESSFYESLRTIADLKSNIIVFFNDNENTRLWQDGAEVANKLFANIGLQYMRVEDVSDVANLIDCMRKAQNMTGSVLIHLNSKNAAFKSAELKPVPYSELTYKLLARKAKTDKNLVVISADTPEVMGFTPERISTFGSQFVNIKALGRVAIGVAVGLAKGGAHPVWGVYSTFLQGVYDQLLQDVAINNSPVTILVFGGGVDGMNNIAHEGFFDISMSVNIPNITILAPTCQEAFEAMLNWSIDQQEGPVIIRVPNDQVHRADYPVDVTTAHFGNYQITHEGSEVAIFGVGTYYSLAKEVAELLQREDVDATIVNPRNLNLYDVNTLEELRQRHRLVVTLEDGVMAGGFGEKIARYYGPSRMKVMVRGLHKRFEDNYDAHELRERNRLLPEQIANDILDIIL